MSNQQYPPQQPQSGWPTPQQPQQPYPPQPGWPTQPQPAWGAPPPPQPPKKRGIGKILGIGCAGIIGLVIIIGIISAAVGGSGKNGSSTASDAKPATAASKDAKAAGSGKTSGGGSAKSDDSKSSSTAVFKVWGSAPAGDLGPLDITYGSDSDTRKGHFANGKFEATLTVAKGAMYEQVSAQLQGSGDINCSVTIGGKTKTGHASGGYNICDAQLSGGLFGGWE